MISKTKIKSRAKKKTNPYLRETLRMGVKSPSWLRVAAVLSSPTRKLLSKNLFEIDREVKLGDTVVVPGKVLSRGEITKKIKICALSISDEAREKLKKSNSEFVPLLREIKSNPKAQGIKVLK